MTYKIYLPILPFAILLFAMLVLPLGLSQPYYFPPAGSNFGTQLNSYGFSQDYSTIMDCYSRTSSMEKYYNSAGYQTQVGFRTTSGTAMDHIYLFVKDPSAPGWAAVDPYFGYMESPSSYYTPDAVYPTWNDYDASRSRRYI